jgi:hypothetical protein
MAFPFEVLDGLVYHSRDNVWWTSLVLDPRSIVFDGDKVYMVNFSVVCGGILDWRTVSVPGDPYNFYGLFAWGVVGSISE